jgi:hypothetical protein
MNVRTRLGRIGVAFQVVVMSDGRSRRMRLWVGMGPRLTGLTVVHPVYAIVDLQTTNVQFNVSLLV